MTQSIKFIILIILILSFSNCTIPEVKEINKGFVVIASDFLYPKDTLLFENFKKLNGIKIIIKHMDADSIQSHYKKYRYNAKIDGVLLYSSYEMNELSKANILQKLPSSYSEIPISFRAPKNDWIAIGLDPYVLDFGDSSAQKASYNELTYGAKWKPVLSKEASAAFYASVIHQFGRKNLHKSKKWLQAMYNHSVALISDSLQTSTMTLNRFSKVMADKHDFTMPNQQKGGAFYDCIGIGILNQSAKYILVNQLIEYVLKPHNNQIILGKISFYPILNPDNHADYPFQNDYPRLFKCSPNKAVREYRDMERILKKLD